VFYVYILYSETIDHYYVGQTSDLGARIESHNDGFVRWTRHGIPWQLKYFEEFETRADAMRRERFLKSKHSRKYIESLITQKSRLNGRVPTDVGINH